MNLSLKNFVLPLVFLFGASTALAQQISSGEFFIDTDPGVGNGTSLYVPAPVDSFSINFGVSTNALSSGFHNLFVRFKYNNGIWGLYEQRPFYIYTASVINTAQIVRAEYFFDTDPGVGNGTGVNINPTDSANINLNIPVSSLSAGFHNLFVRFKYNNGKWGLHEQRSFYIYTASVPNTAQIVRAEYFFDTDPGVGNGTTVNISPTDSANVNINADATGLSTGSHILYVRFKYNDGKWGLHEARAFTVCTTVTPSSITPQGISTICPSSSIVLNANTGNGFTYQWQRDGVTINGATNSTYTASVAGVYNVIVTSNNCPSISNSVTIVVSTPTATITTQNSTTFCAGDSVVLTANSGNGLNYQWKLNGTNINGANSVNYTATQAGSYTVVVAQGNCNATSTAVTVTVNPGTSITTQPQSQSTCIGGNVAFTAVGVGSGLTYQWFKAGSPINGANNTTYTINGATALDAGDYTVVVSGSCGSVTSQVAVLSVSGSLTISQQPQSQIVCQGQSVTIEVIANGTNTQYQWQLNGVNINGATNNTYIIGNANLNNSGSYSVNITSGCGNATSQTAILTVNPNTGTTLNQSICNGNSFNFNGNLLTLQGVYYDTLQSSISCDSIVILNLTVNSPNPVIQQNGNNLSTSTFNSYQWLLNGSAIIGAQGQSYTATENGAYSISVTDLNGCTDTSDTVIVLTVGIDKNSLGGLMIFPNPTSNELYLTGETKNNNRLYVDLRDVTGRLISKLNIKQTGAIKELIYLDYLNSGIYYLFVYNSENEQKIFKISKID